MPHPFRRAALYLGVVCLLPALPAAAQPEGRGRGNQGGGTGSSQVSISFTPDEIARVRAWFAARPEYRAQPLPPGVARNLARGKPLPPGIARRQAPPELVAILSRRPGATYTIVGGALVLLSSASIVADMVEDALR